MSKKSKKAKKKAEEKIKKYYKEKATTAKSNAATATQRLKEDLDKIYEYSGIAKTRAIEDYNTNIGNIEANKSADVASLNDYVSTGMTRTTEDLNTSLSKEHRRYSLEYDATNQDMANRGMTFSERTPEKQVKEATALNQADIQTEAQRSFQDIARYETAQTTAMALKYGQQTEEATTTKNRTIEDIMNDTNNAVTANQRNTEDIATGLSQQLTDFSYGKDSDIATIDQLIDNNASAIHLAEQQNHATG